MFDDRFIELLSKKLAGEINEQERMEFLRAVDHDPACKDLYAELSTYWVKDESQYANSTLMFSKIRNRIIDEQITETKRPSFPLTMLAACIAAIALTFFIYYYTPIFKWKKQTSNYQIVKTKGNNKRQFTLSDGTVVTLNAQSEFRYPSIFNTATREVYLNGEAFFQVAKDRKHPFIVHANKMKIRVLGTEFNVKSYPEDTFSEASLIKGMIELTLEDRPSDRIILKPNEKLVLEIGAPAAKGKSIKKKAAHHSALETRYSLTNLTYFSQADTLSVETSWMQNRLVFKNESFFELSHTIERRYGVKIKFKSEKIKDYRFTGEFERETLEQVLAVLQMIEPFHYKREKNRIYIYDK